MNNANLDMAYDNLTDAIFRLRESLSTATAVEADVIIEMVGDAVKIENRLKRFRQSVQQDQEEK